MSRPPSENPIPPVEKPDVCYPDSTPTREFVYDLIEHLYGRLSTEFTRTTPENNMDAFRTSVIETFPEHFKASNAIDEDTTG